MKLVITLKDNGGLTIDTDEGERKLEFVGSKKEGLTVGMADCFSGLKIEPGVTGTVTLELKGKSVTGYQSAARPAGT